MLCIIFQVMANTRANFRGDEEGEWDQEIHPQVPNKDPPQDQYQVTH